MDQPIEPSQPSPRESYEPPLVAEDLPLEISTLNCGSNGGKADAGCQAIGGVVNS